MCYFRICFLIIWTLHISVHQTLANCSNYQINYYNKNINKNYDPNSLENPKQMEAFTPRSGIHYVVIPNSLYSVDDPQSKCPYGSSPTYIKSLEDWDDWKFILGMPLFNSVIKFD